MENISIYPCLPRTERGKPLVLSPDPKGENFLYTNGNHVIIRNLKNFENNDIYSQHSVQASVAKYSPSRFYIASGDVSGKVRIWDTTQKEHILKAEYQPIGGPVGDLAWGEDSKRLVIGGSGRDKFASAILVDTGSTTGELMGMSRPINSIDLKQTRPYRVITGSEDNLVCFFEGPPFKFKNSHTCHTNFVNSVRYSPTGLIFVSAGADGKIFSFDGKTGDLIGEVGPDAHSGGIYALEFSPKGDYLASVSADKSIKFWKVNETEITPAGKYQLENNVQNILLSVTWSGDTIVACSLAGYLYFFDQTDLSSPKTVVYGHSKPITCSSYNREQNCFVTASMDGTMAIWPRTNSSVEPGNCVMVSTSDQAHKNQIQSVVTCGDLIASVGIDDRLVIASLSSKTYVAATKLDSQPRSIAYAAANSLVAIATIGFLYVFSVDGVETAEKDLANGPLVKLPLKHDSDAIAINSQGTVIAVGHDDGEITFYLTTAGNQVVPQTGLAVRVKQKVTALAFSPDGKHLASTDADRCVTVFAVQESGAGLTVTSVTQEWWRFHNARANCLAWHPDSRRLASGSLDCSIIIWNLDDQKNRIHQVNAHPMSQITSLAWESKDVLLSTGQDACIKRWKVLA